MSEPTFRLSPRQLVVLVFTLSLCVTVFWVPAMVDRQLGREGWLPCSGSPQGSGGRWRPWASPAAFPDGRSTVPSWNCSARYRAGRISRL